ncbi:MAG: hypothetical protein A2521_16565 [Deltaproteobacteria bacterium RIFOXYD12_FULL_57_12]|nr:MAG: hypothetical protein A2521_16565 [Deltaproteobacteria bacterium RIFOXYD12_FULL_57_12]
MFNLENLLMAKSENVLGHNRLKIPAKAADMNDRGKTAYAVNGAMNGKKTSRQRQSGGWRVHRATC